MANNLKIGADTSEAKKQILDLNKSISNVSKSKIQIFSDDEKKFMKTELNKELTAMKDNLTRNKRLITELVREQDKMVEGSKEERQQRDKIVRAYQVQAKLAKQIRDTEKASKDLGPTSMGEKATGMMGKLGKFGKGLGAAALAATAIGIPLGISSTQQFQQGVGTRNRLSGLGVNEQAQFGPETIAGAGMNTQEFNERRMNAVSRLGRAGGSQQSILQQAQFERAYGLESGSMLNTATALRGQFGGQQADQAQAELQASIMASGMEDAIAPYLETMTTLLGQLNENGMTNTTELISAIGEITAQGKRTPEQLARTFTNVNESIKGSTGEANAFLQMAFARGGIGGNTIGGTRFAMETGGILGLDQSEFQKLGFDNPALMNQLESEGQFSGLQDRASAVLQQFKDSAGMNADQGIGDITDPSQLQALQNMSNKIFGTRGTGGLEAISALSQVETGEMSKEDFNKKLQQIQEGKNPQAERLEKINSSVAGQSEVLRNIEFNLKEVIGRDTTAIANSVQEIKNAMIRAQGEVVQGGAGGISGFMDKVAGGFSYLSKGGLGGDIYDKFFDRDVTADRSTMAPAASRGANFVPDDHLRKMTDAVSQGVQTGMSKKAAQNITTKNSVNVKVNMPNGKVLNRTHK